MCTLFTARNYHTSGDFYIDLKNTFLNTRCRSEESFIKYSKTTMSGKNLNMFKNLWCAYILYIQRTFLSIFSISLTNNT